MQMQYVVNRLLTLLACLMATAAYADESVHGYMRHNGVYVEPYHRTAPDNNVYNNYGVQGNPYHEAAPHNGVRQSAPSQYYSNPYASQPGAGTYGTNGGGTYE